MIRPGPAGKGRSGGKTPSQRKPSPGNAGSGTMPPAATTSTSKKVSVGQVAIWIMLCPLVLLVSVFCMWVLWLFVRWIFTPAAAPTNQPQQTQAAEQPTASAVPAKKADPAKCVEEVWQKLRYVSNCRLTRLQEEVTVTYNPKRDGQMKAVDLGSCLKATEQIVSGRKGSHLATFCEPYPPAQLELCNRTGEGAVSLKDNWRYGLTGCGELVALQWNSSAPSPDVTYRVNILHVILDDHRDVVHDKAGGVPVLQVICHNLPAERIFHVPLPAKVGDTAVSYDMEVRLIDRHGRHIPQEAGHSLFVAAGNSVELANGPHWRGHVAPGDGIFVAKIAHNYPDGVDVLLAVRPEIVP
ncbi:MAG: hypothetical protein Q8P73_00755 [bacterium]|nr:hypothetical protein [bacterium]